MGFLLPQNQKTHNPDSDYQYYFMSFLWRKHKTKIWQKLCTRALIL